MKFQWEANVIGSRPLGDLFSLLGFTFVEPRGLCLLTNLSTERSCPSAPPRHPASRAAESSVSHVQVVQVQNIFWSLVLSELLACLDDWPILKMVKCITAGAGELSAVHFWQFLSHPLKRRYLIRILPLEILGSSGSSISGYYQPLQVLLHSRWHSGMALLLC